MIPAFSLTRSIEILVTRFAGEVAKEEKRPELMPFLLMARDRGVIADSSAAGHLLGASEGRWQVARRLLEQLERSGALEKQEKDGWKLTQAGHEAVETEAVFIAERGSWEVWHVCDPLLPHGLIQLTEYTELAQGFAPRADHGRGATAHRRIADQGGTARVKDRDTRMGGRITAPQPDDRREMLRSCRSKSFP